MKDAPDKAKTEFGLVQLIPNMLTITAICAGLSAIRFGVQGNYVLAVQLIMAAIVLDGLDGRIARYFSSDSEMGAELDSLADFVNFGVAPALVIYFWALQDMRSAAWISVLVFVICCVVRLARFNVSSKAECDHAPSAYFVGVPSPAGALLVMLPMFISFAFANRPLLPDVVICANMVVVGLLMISHIPTWSIKTVRISGKNVKFFLVGFVFIGAAALTYAWITLVVLCFGYIAMVIWCLATKASKDINKET
jgi:CDP-diacylglycerol--serine O-phosphatidyltransferase